MSIHKLMAEFQQIPFASVANPNAKVTPWAEDVARLVVEHPVLKLYPDYTDFLACYGGAGIYPEDESSLTYFTIYGFGSDYEDLFSSPVDDEGFYAFGATEFRYRPPISGKNAVTDGSFFAHFAIDITGHREQGIYGPQVSISRALQGRYELRWSSFVNWLAEIVAHRGRIEYRE